VCPNFDGAHRALNSKTLGRLFLGDCRGLGAGIDFRAADGIEVNGVEYPLEASVSATGFAAMTGSFDKIRIAGRNGLTLSEKWSLIQLS
jgi:hypothetical protein